jgi:1,4-dihydroxy-2-naphthoate octaprenyltransferase
LGLGDIFVFIFFGPVAVGGTYYVQSLEINDAVILAGIGPGLLSTAILVVNNYRDIESDQKAGKKTLAVRFGRSFAQSEYLLCIMGATLMPIVLYVLTEDYREILLACSIGLLAIPAIKTVLTKTDGPSLNKALALTGQLLLVYSILFSFGWTYDLFASHLKSIVPF